jgi:hypothetical protein
MSVEAAHRAICRCAAYGVALVNDFVQHRRFIDLFARYQDMAAAPPEGYAVVGRGVIPAFDAHRKYLGAVSQDETEPLRASIQSRGHKGLQWVSVEFL